MLTAPPKALVRQRAQDSAVGGYRPPPPPPPPVRRWFSDAAAWNIPAAGLPTATAATNAGLDSATLVSRLLAASPYLKCTLEDETFTLFVADPSTPLATLAIDDVPGGSVPNGTQIPWSPAWVPSGGPWLTGGARPGPSDRDAQATVLVPATGKEYDLWRVSYDAGTSTLHCAHAHQSTDSYLTGLGERLKDRSIGILLAAMTVRAVELASQQDIGHALALAIPNQHPSIFYRPALSTDGINEGGGAPVPAGTRLALTITDAQIETLVATYPASLSTAERDAGRKLMRALRDYGFFITDHAASAHFYLEDRNSAGAVYTAAGLDPVTIGGVPYPNRLLDIPGLLTASTVRAIVPSDQYVAAPPASFQFPLNPPNDPEPVPGVTGAQGGRFAYWFPHTLLSFAASVVGITDGVRLVGGATGSDNANGVGYFSRMALTAGAWKVGFTATMTDRQPLSGSQRFTRAFFCVGMAGGASEPGNLCAWNTVVAPSLDEYGRRAQGIMLPVYDRSASDVDSSGPITWRPLYADAVTTPGADPGGATHDWTEDVAHPWTIELSGSTLTLTQTVGGSPRVTSITSAEVAALCATGQLGFVVSPGLTLEITAFRVLSAAGYGSKGPLLLDGRRWPGTTIRYGFPNAGFAGVPSAIFGAGIDLRDGWTPFPEPMRAAARRFLADASAKVGLTFTEAAAIANAQLLYVLTPGLNASDDNADGVGRFPGDGGCVYIASNLAGQDYSDGGGGAHLLAHESGHSALVLSHEPPGSGIVNTYDVAANPGSLGSLMIHYWLNPVLAYTLQPVDVAAAQILYGLLREAATVDRPTGPPPPDSFLEIDTGPVDVRPDPLATVRENCVIKRTGDKTGVDTVRWSVAGEGDNPAQAADFSGARSGTLTFQPGDAQRPASFDIAARAPRAAARGAVFTIGNPVGATVIGVPARSFLILPKEPDPGDNQSGLPWLSGVTTQSNIPSQNAGFVSFRGRKVDIVNSKVVGRGAGGTWADMERSLRGKASDYTAWKNAKCRISQSVPMMPGSPGMTMREAAVDGDADAYHKELATILNGHDCFGALIIRLGHEYSDDGNSYSPVHDSDQTNFSNYKGLFRRLSDIYRAKGFEVDWCDLRVHQGINTSAVFPGSDYMDYIGADCYSNASTIDTDEHWDDYADAGTDANPQGPRRWIKYAISNGKKWSFAEWACTRADDNPVKNSVPLDPPLYIKGMFEMFKHAAETNPDNIGYEVYFNVDGSDGGRVDHAVQPVNRFPLASAEYVTRWTPP